jgi:hypothetical protein
MRHCWKKQFARHSAEITVSATTRKERENKVKRRKLQIICPANNADAAIFA